MIEALARIGVAAICAFVALAPSGCGDERKAAPSEPSAGSWRTWVVAPERLAVEPPPTPRSERARRDLAAVRSAAERRTPEQRRAVRYWGQDPAVGPWIERMLDLQAGRLAQKDPPAAARAYALVSVAMYDAVVTTWRAKYEYRRAAPEDVDAAVPAGPEPSYPSEHAAIARAASRVLAHIFEEEPAARFDELADEAARSRVVAGTNYPSDVEVGLAIGRRAAERVIARARRDGYVREWNGKRPRGRAYWEPPPGSVAAPVRPTAGRWRPWVLRSGSQLRPPPPPRYGSAQFLAEAREVLRVSRSLTPEQKRTATLWAAGEGTALPPGLWNQVTLAQVRQSDLSTPRAARTFALLNVAGADAAIACWDAKYAYWSPRPENAIRDLGLARRWKPLLKTPFFPAYPSGHSTFSSAAAEVLAHLFPGRAAQFRARAREAGMSRIYGGIHFRADNEAGLGMGTRIGRAVVARARTDGAER